MPESAEIVQANIRKLGFELSQVRVLLNSHAHFDHAGGLAELAAVTGAQVVASAGDRDALERGVYPGWEARHVFDFPPVKVDRVIGDGESIRLGELVLTAHLTPGHSQGCTSYAFTAREQGREHRALVFCSGSVAANRLYPEPQYEGIVEDFRATFRRLAEMAVDVYLAPHAEQFDMVEKRARLGDGGAHPFVDPTEKDRRIASFERAFEKALAAQSQR